MIGNLNLAIIDDDLDNIRIVSRHLGSYQSQISITGKFTNPMEALNSLKNRMPDLLLLDIEMPQMNGFQLLNELGSKLPEVIFITGHDEYAIKAIKCAAIDYILKPFSCEELHDALNKVKERIGNKSLRIQKIKKVIQGKPDPRIVVPGTSAYLSITYNDILYLRAIRGGYTMFHMLDGKKSLATNPLNYYENLLGPNGFFRTHKSHLVNLEHVMAYEPNLLLTRMIDDTELDLATRRKSNFLQEWKKIQSMVRST